MAGCKYDKKKSAQNCGKHQPTFRECDPYVVLLSGLKSRAELNGKYALCIEESTELSSSDRLPLKLGVDLSMNPKLRYADRDSVLHIKRVNCSSVQVLYWLSAIGILMRVLLAM